MRIQPMPFIAPMVRGLLCGRKTQTRRAAPPSDEPRFRAGDIIWVQERYRSVAGEIEYAADYPENYRAEEPFRFASEMTADLSRVTLEVIQVDVIPLQSITDEDCIAEGVVPARFSRGVTSYVVPWLDTPCTSARAAYADLWGILHGDADWTRNPDVYRLRFDTYRANVRTLT